jgi:hypothetical protein
MTLDWRNEVMYDSPIVRVRRRRKKRAGETRGRMDGSSGNVVSVKRRSRSRRFERNRVCCETCDKF